MEHFTWREITDKPQVMVGPLCAFINSVSHRGSKHSRFITPTSYFKLNAYRFAYWRGWKGRNLSMTWRRGEVSADVHSLPQVAYNVLPYNPMSFMSLLTFLVVNVLSS